MKTLQDFKKRTNDQIPSIFNYELISDKYKFSIYKMLSPIINFTVEEKRLDGRFYNEYSQVIDSLEEGVDLTNEWLRGSLVPTK